MEYTRKCPKCNRELHYASASGLKLACKRNSNCYKCCALNKSARQIAASKIFVANFATSKNTGSKNSFFGHHHTEETKLKVGQHRKGVSIRHSGSFTPESSSGPNNAMYGKSVYSVWCNKFGIERAKELLAAQSAKKSVAFSGSRNPMYGKPTPGGAGRGWKGWYNGWFFRSLRELAYVIHLDGCGVKWRSAECNELTIAYKDWNNVDRTYRADFLVADRFLVEVKPKKLMQSVAVQAKEVAAEAFCSNNNLKYVLIDPAPLSDTAIQQLYFNGIITFTPMYEKMYEIKYAQSSTKIAS